MIFTFWEDVSVGILKVRKGYNNNEILGYYIVVVPNILFQYVQISKSQCFMRFQKLVQLMESLRWDAI